jgi:hypothetical protein
MTKTPNAAQMTALRHIAATNDSGRINLGTMKTLRRNGWIIWQDAETIQTCNGPSVLRRPYVTESGSAHLNG